MAKNVQATYPNILRTADQVQTDDGLLWTPPVWKHRTASQQGLAHIAGKTPGADSESNQMIGLRITSFTLQNLATASPVGIGWRLVNHIWEAGRYDGTTYTRLDALKARTATAIQVTGADQTGFVILSTEKIGWVSVNITTAETDAGGATVPDHAIQFSAAGAAWTTTAAGLEDDFTLTNTVWTATIKNFCWLPASTWAKTDTHTGLPVGMYALRFTSAHREASDVAAIATGIEVGQFAELLNTLAQNGIYEEDPVGRPNEYYSPYANGLVAYFGTANVQNLVTAAVESA